MLMTAELMTRDEVQARLKSSRATIYKLVSHSGFPLPLKIGRAQIGGARTRWRVGLPQGREPRSA